MSGDKEKRIPGRFTDKSIANLPAEEKMYQERETNGGGFGVRVLPSGLRIFIFIYTIAGKRRQMNLGSYPDITLATARKRCIEAKGVLHNGKDPQDHGFKWHYDPERIKAEENKKIAEELENPTVKMLADEYMKLYAKKNKRESSWREDERLLNKDIIPVWGKKKAKDVSRKDVIKLLDNVSVRGAALTHNIFKLTRKMFNFAVSRDILNGNPCTGVKIDEIASIQSRDRVLREPKDNNGVDEILTFWRELEKAAMSDYTKRILKLILVTGQRPGEVAGIRASEVTADDELGGAWWTIPVFRRKVKEKSKNPPQPHKLYLSKLALELLGEPKEGGFYFPSPVVKEDSDKNPIYSHIDENAVAYAIRKNLKDYQPRRAIKGKKIVMEEVPEEKKMAIDHFTPHDLRRTHATRLAAMEFSDEVIDAVLGHSKKGVVGIYNRHDYLKRKKAASEAMEQHILGIIEGAKAGNVVSLEQERAKRVA